MFQVENIFQNRIFSDAHSLTYKVLRTWNINLLMDFDSGGASDAEIASTCSLNFLILALNNLRRRTSAWNFTRENIKRNDTIFFLRCRKIYQDVPSNFRKKFLRCNDRHVPRCLTESLTETSKTCPRRNDKSILINRNISRASVRINNLAQQDKNNREEEVKYGGEKSRSTFSKCARLKREQHNEWRK